MSENPKNTEKMAALGRMTRGLIHDFNNSLASIMGYAEFLVTDLQPESEQHIFASNIKTAGLQMQELIDQIRALSQEKGQGKDLTLHLNENIEALIAQFKDIIPFHQSIEFDNTGSDAVLTIPPHQVRTLISNLIKNAIQSLGGKPGLVMIRLAASPKIHEKYEHTATLLETEISTSPIAYIDITDTGCGMDEDLLSLAPQPLFTTHAAGDSHGMGLPVAFGILKYLGGGLKILTSPNKGTTVSISLPVEELIESTGDSDLDQTPPSPLNILLVEDRELVRHTIETMLHRDGHTVTSCTNGMDALDALREHPDKFNLLITDYTMPVLNGKDLIEEVRTDFPELPIILTSGDSGFLKDTLTEAKADSKNPSIAVLPKPTSAKNLRRIIERVVSKK